MTSVTGPNIYKKEVSKENWNVSGLKAGKIVLAKKKKATSYAIVTLTIHLTNRRKMRRQHVLPTKPAELGNSCIMLIFMPSLDLRKYTGIIQKCFCNALSRIDMGKKIHAHEDLEKALIYKEKSVLVLQTLLQIGLIGNIQLHSQRLSSHITPNHGLTLEEQTLYSFGHTPYPSSTFVLHLLQTMPFATDHILQLHPSWQTMVCACFANQCNTLRSNTILQSQSAT